MSLGARIEAPGQTLTFRATEGQRRIDQAEHIARFEVTAGSLVADIAASGKVIALSVKGGDFTGHLAADSIGSIRVAKDKAGIGGSMTGSTITAKSIGAVLLDGNLVDSFVLAGASLGADFSLGGAGGSADQFAEGSLRTFMAKGNVTNSIVGAGFSPGNGLRRPERRGDRQRQSKSHQNLHGQKGARCGEPHWRCEVSEEGHGQWDEVRADEQRAVHLPGCGAADRSGGSCAGPRSDGGDARGRGDCLSLCRAERDPDGSRAGDIEPARAAVLRGRVLRRDNTPLPGVMVTILDHPEFGRTHCRADGLFDIAVNGGGPLVVKFDAPDFCPVQRQIDRDPAGFRDAARRGVDRRRSAGDHGHARRRLGDADARSERRKRRLRSAPRGADVPAGHERDVQNGRRHRASRARDAEYSRDRFTVGANGPNAMPGVLPPNSAYTYCAELTADETPAGATWSSPNQSIFTLKTF